MMNSRWYVDKTSENEIILYSLEEIIYSGNSAYQKIEIINTGNLGKCLLLDGKMQSAEVDEFIYHEALVHPVMLISKSPKKVLVAGGGEGATIREVLKYPVEEVVMVDLDEEIIRICMQYLPEWNNGAFNDPRVKLVIDDARAYITKIKNYFDVIIIDLPEPTEGGPALLLYTKEFYEIVKTALTDKGVMVTQAASVSTNNLKFFVSVVKTLEKVFPYVKPYTTYIPSFFAPWGFVLASKTIAPDIAQNNIKEMPEEIKNNLKFYDFDAHISMFSLPKYIKEAIQKEGVVISDDNPVSFY